MNIIIFKIFLIFLLANVSLQVNERSYDILENHPRVMATSPLRMMRLGRMKMTVKPRLPRPTTRRMLPRRG
uniref:Uncharacterized protein n=1 Tax=Parastrongyloides trichosuri TaxID=131310 RepID=A0A0N4ZDL8_PARTI